MKRFVAILTLVGLISCARDGVVQEDPAVECRDIMPAYSETMIGISETWDEELMMLAIVVQLSADSVSTEDAARLVADSSLKGFEDLRTEAGQVQPPQCLAEHHSRYLGGMDIVLEMLEALGNGILPEPETEPFSDSKQEMGLLRYALEVYQENEVWFFDNLDQLNVDRIVVVMATAQVEQELTAESSVQVETEYIGDGSRFMTLKEDSVSIWDSDSGSNIVTIGYSLMNNCQLDDYAISPDGNILAIPGCYGICLWDTTTGDRMTSISIPEFGSVCPWLHDLHFAFSPDSASLAFGSRVYDVGSGKEMLYLDHEPDQEPETAVHFSEFSPDGEKLATIDENGSVRIWDSATGDQLFDLSAENIAAGQEYAPSQDQIITIEDTLDETTIRFWDADGNTLIKTFNVTPDMSLGSIAVVDPSGHLLATKEDEHIYVWDTVTDEKLAEFAGPVGYVSALAFSPDGTMLAAGGSNNKAVIWDVASGQQIASLVGHVDSILSLEFSPDDQRLATGSDDGTARIWDIASGEQILALIEHEDGASDVAFSPQGAWLATASRGGPARIWDTGTGNVLMTFPKLELPDWSPPTYPSASVAFNNDGSQLVTGGEAEQVVVWNIETGEMASAIPTWASSVAFAGDGQRVVVHKGSTSGKVGIYDAASGEPVRHQGGTFEPLDAAFTPDGKLFVTAGCQEFENWTNCSRGLVYVFDAQTGWELHKLYGHKGAISDLDISSDGTLLVTVASDDTACLWDLEAGERLMTLQHDDSSASEPFWKVTLSPTDNFFQTYSPSNKVVSLWDVASGQLLHNFEGVASADISPDGKQILIITNLGEIKILDARSGGLLLEITDSPEPGQVLQPTIDYEYLRELSAEVNLHLQIGDFEEALSLCDELIDLDPDTQENYVLRSRAHEGIGDFGNAIADAQTAIELGETSADAYNSLCWFYGLTAEPELALPYCQYAVEQKVIWEYMDSRGLVLGQLGDFEGAISDFQFVVDDLEGESDPYLQSIHDQRKEWLDALREGENPFTPGILAELRGEIE